MQRILILLGGLPGSGKTTLAESIHHHLNRPTFSGDAVVITAADDYHVNDKGEWEWKAENLDEAHKRCKRRVREAMAFETPVIIVHNTFTRLWERHEYHDMGQEAGYQVHDLVCLNIHGNSNVHGVPADKLKQMAQRFELPLYPKPEHVPGYGKSIHDILQHLAMVPQSAFWHPEGDVLKHTLIVMVRALEYDTPELVWAALFHDLGKIETTRFNPERGRITAFGHENVSVKYWERFRYLALDTIDKNLVEWLVANHMKLKFELSEKKLQQLIDEGGEKWFDLLELFNELDKTPTNWQHYLHREDEAWAWLEKNVFRE